MFGFNPRDIFNWFFRVKDKDLKFLNIPDNYFAVGFYIFGLMVCFGVITSNFWSVELFLASMKLSGYHDITIQVFNGGHIFYIDFTPIFIEPSTTKTTLEFISQPDKNYSEKFKLFQETLQNLSVLKSSTTSFNIWIFNTNFYFCIDGLTPLLRDFSCYFIEYWIGFWFLFSFVCIPLGFRFFPKTTIIISLILLSIIPILFFILFVSCVFVFICWILKNLGIIRPSGLGIHEYSTACGGGPIPGVRLRNIFVKTFLFYMSHVRIGETAMNFIPVVIRVYILWYIPLSILGAFVFYGPLGDLFDDFCTIRERDKKKRLGLWIFNYKVYYLYFIMLFKNYSFLKLATFNFTRRRLYLRFNSTIVGILNSFLKNIELEKYLFFTKDRFHSIILTKKKYYSSLIYNEEQKQIQLLITIHDLTSKIDIIKQQIEDLKK